MRSVPEALLFEVARTNQEVDNTTENTLWGKLNVSAGENIDVTLNATHGVRDTSGYNLVAETTLAQNPLMRKYNMADRIRDTGSIQLDFTASDLINIGLSIAQSRDDYSDSILGLTESQETSYNLDASAILTAVTTIYGFAASNIIKSEQAARHFQRRTGLQATMTPSTPSVSVRNTS